MKQMIAMLTKLIQKEFKVSNVMFCFILSNNYHDINKMNLSNFN